MEKPKFESGPAIENSRATSRSLFGTGFAHWPNEKPAGCPTRLIRASGAYPFGRSEQECPVLRWSPTGTD